MTPIIVSISEIANIFAIDERVVRKLAAAGLIVRTGPAKYDLIASTTHYMSHLREIAAGIVSRAPKDEALIALKLLRDAQRRSIEKKRKSGSKFQRQAICSNVSPSNNASEF